MSVVVLKYEDLVSGKDLGDEIYKAYGPKGLGALLVSGIPRYAELRNNLLPCGYKLAHASEDVKKKLEHEPSLWNVGASSCRPPLKLNPSAFCLLSLSLFPISYYIYSILGGVPSGMTCSVILTVSCAFFSSAFASTPNAANVVALLGIC